MTGRTVARRRIATGEERRIAMREARRSRSRSR